ncbi:MAG: TetR/AcrR family transcriptional regulator [Chryseobacterium sp.]|nr:MAG: TetR/AcrR family transcriptional regulator [Chryseobacterium sp.]
MVETDKKRELIIEGAIKRFIHFGINKTTMNEIADDLSVSKPSLYYYFPDKSSLILGVVDKIFKDYFDALRKVYLPEAALEDTLTNFINTGHHFFQRYYMLHLSGGSPDSSLNSPELREYIMTMKNRSLEFHSGIFSHAIDKGEIEVNDVLKITELYLASQSGITSLCIMHGNKELFPNKKDLREMLDKQIALSGIFVKGLKK